MNTATRIRRLAARKVGVQITKRQRRCVFIVSGPDGRIEEARTRAEALNLLLARLRCWSVPPWKISARQYRLGIR